jgi:hypothetical protein
VYQAAAKWWSSIASASLTFALLELLRSPALANHPAAQHITHLLVGCADLLSAATIHLSVLASWTFLLGAVALPLVVFTTSPLAFHARLIRATGEWDAWLERYITFSEEQEPGETAKAARTELIERFRMSMWYVFLALVVAGASDERHPEGRVLAVDVGKSMLHVVLWIPLLIVPFAGWMWAMVVGHLLVRKAEAGINAGEECSSDRIHKGRFEGRAGTYKREGTKV